MAVENLVEIPTNSFLNRSSQLPRCTTNCTHKNVTENEYMSNVSENYENPKQDSDNTIKNNYRNKKPNKEIIASAELLPQISFAQAKECISDKIKITKFMFDRRGSHCIGSHCIGFLHRACRNRYNFFFSTGQTSKIFFSVDNFQK